MEDAEVSKSLLAIATLPAERIQYFSHHIPLILNNKAKSRDRLLEVARLPKVERLDFLVAGFGRAGIGSEDTEVADAILVHSFDKRGVFDATGDLFAVFPYEPRVREMALCRLDDVEAPWSILARAYSDDIEIRNRIERQLLIVPAWLRSTVVAALSRRAGDSETNLEQLAQYRSESDTEVRTTAAIAYYESISPDAVDQEEALEKARVEVNAIGPYMDLISRAGLVGYIALDRFKDFVELPGWHAERHLSVDIFLSPGNSALLVYVARHWERLKRVARESIFSYFDRFRDNRLGHWESLSPYIGESEALKRDFLDYAHECATAMPSQCIEALAREMPGSRLLRDHCFRHLRFNADRQSISPFDARRSQIVVGRVLARQYANDGEVLHALERCAFEQNYISAAIVGLSTGWPTNSLLSKHFSILKNDGGLKGCVLSDFAYIYSALGTIDEFCEFLAKMLVQAEGNIWEFLPFCLDPIVGRIKSSASVADKLRDVMVSERSGSIRASIPRLLVLAGHMNDELRGYYESQLALEYGGLSIPDYGMDIVAGQYRPVAHALLDALFAR